jgi:oligoendopeptidase F
LNDFSARITNRSLFFDLWWKKSIDEKNAERLLTDAAELGHYLRRSRELAKYTLTEPEEKVINIKDTTGVGFIRNFYDQYTERFEFRLVIDGEKKALTKPELIALFQSPDSEKREGAYRTLFEVYGGNEDILGELYNNVVRDWKNEGVHLRGYDTPIMIRNIANDIPDNVVETLLSVCQRNRHVFQRYFEQKAQLLGMEKMSRYHIYAPMNGQSDETIPFSQAVELVLTSLNAFTPQMSTLAHRVLEENHVDSEVRKGKRSGAFCATASPNITPYILMSYTGRQRSVFTLAHELGHAIHSQLAADKSILVQQAPLPLAELASVFAEMIVTENVFKTASNEEKKRLMVRQLDDMYATIMRQAYFTLFEQKAHEAIPNGATARDLSEIYLQDLKAQFGDSTDVPHEFTYEWTYVPHFYHTPFYTYAYSFGNLLTISLYQEYQLTGEKFISTYLDLLSSGGSQNPERLLKEYGIDIGTATFWQKGFDYIAQRVAELSRL